MGGCGSHRLGCDYTLQVKSHLYNSLFKIYLGWSCNVTDIGRTLGAKMSAFINSWVHDECPDTGQNAFLIKNTKNVIFYLLYFILLYCKCIIYLLNYCDLRQLDYA